MDLSAFFNGVYIRRAIASCFDKKNKFPDGPLLQQQNKASESLSGEEQFKLWIAQFNKNFDKR